jgi:hypothetical protein
MSNLESSVKDTDHNKMVTQTAPGHTQQTGDTGADRPATEQEGRHTSTRGGLDINHGDLQSTQRLCEYRTRLNIYTHIYIIIKYKLKC